MGVLPLCRTNWGGGLVGDMIEVTVRVVCGLTRVGWDGRQNRIPEEVVRCMECGAITEVCFRRAAGTMKVLCVTWGGGGGGGGGGRDGGGKRSFGFAEAAPRVKTSWRMGVDVAHDDVIELEKWLADGWVMVGSGGGEDGTSSVNMFKMFSSRDGSLSSIIWMWWRSSSSEVRLLGGKIEVIPFNSALVNSDCLTGCCGRSGKKYLLELITLPEVTVADDDLDVNEFETEVAVVMMDWAVAFALARPMTWLLEKTAMGGFLTVACNVRISSGCNGSGTSSCWWPGW